MPKPFLGELEQAIVDAVWRTGQTTVRDVLESLHRQRTVAYTTVMTVMNRLVRQGYLRRHLGSNGAYTYVARRSREHASAEATRQTINQLVQRYGDVALVQFLDRLDRVSEDKLAKLRRRARRTGNP